MLNYTGHPLVDVGIATITAFAEKDDPSELVEADLDRVADYITREYTRQPLKSFLTVAFPNSGFTQPAFEKTPERRLEYARKVLHSYGAGVPTLPERCVFTGKPAVAVAFGDKEGLPPGRAFRQHIPLLTGEEVINFHPHGEAGLPVSGEALLAIQAFPLGTAKCGGRLLAVHSDHSETMLDFARAFLVENRRTIQLAQTAGSSKLPESQFSYRTLLIHTLLSALVRQRDVRAEKIPISITAYHLSNSGQGVDLNIYHLPMEITAFLMAMESAEYHRQWQAIVGRAWEVPPLKKTKKESEPFRPRRNWLYEDLFTLPDQAARFIRTYFLRVALHYAKSAETDPRGGYSVKTEADLVSWKITTKFLERILHMEKERVEQIRQLGDALAGYVKGQNDRRFFREFFTVQRYDYLRNLLLKANIAQTRRGQPPLINFDTYIAIFEEGEELARPDWRLARDLVLIRMVEQLYHLEWLKANLEALPEEEELSPEVGPTGT